MTEASNTRNTVDNFMEKYGKREIYFKNTNAQENKTLHASEILKSDPAFRLTEIEVAYGRRDGGARF